MTRSGHLSKGTRARVAAWRRRVSVAFIGVAAAVMMMTASAGPAQALFGIGGRKEAPVTRLTYMPESVYQEREELQKFVSLVVDYHFFPILHLSDARFLSASPFFLLSFKRRHSHTTRALLDMDENLHLVGSNRQLYENLRVVSERGVRLMGSWILCSSALSGRLIALIFHACGLFDFRHLCICREEAGVIVTCERQPARGFSTTPHVLRPS